MEKNQISNKEVTLLENKANKYNAKDEVSFEVRKFFKNIFMRGTIVSCKYVYYKWIYLVECAESKKLLTIPEDEIWPLEPTQ